MTSPIALRKTVLTTFEDRGAAERALHHLVESGFDESDISLVMTEEALAREFGPRGPSSPESATKGGAWGSLLGALVGALVAMSVVAFPGIGLVAVGPLLAAAAGAGAGGAAGTLIGTLVGSGVREAEAQAAVDAVAKGRILLAVHSELGLAPRAKAILHDEGGLVVGEPGADV